MRSTLACLLTFALATAPSTHAQQEPFACGVPDLGAAEIELLKKLDWSQIPTPPPGKVVYKIPVAFHVIYAGSEGRVSNAQVASFIEQLNWGFRDSPFTFVLDKVDRTNKRSWYLDCSPGTKNEKAMKKRLARDPLHVLNVYSCKVFYPPGQGVTGFSTFPFSHPNGSFMHGILMNPVALPGSGHPLFGKLGLVGVHEVGHSLGAFHTFQGGCTGDGDFVADTPAQAYPHNACPLGIDTCLDGEGPDDVPNFMNYSNDDCMFHFTPGQVELMLALTSRYRPTLLR